MNEFGPKSTLEDLECFIKNRNAAMSLRPPQFSNSMWAAVITKRGTADEVVGYGSKVWIAIDNASRLLK